MEPSDSMTKEITDVKAEPVKDIFDLVEVWKGRRPDVYGIRIYKDPKRHCTTTTKIRSCDCPRQEDVTLKFCGFCGNRYTTQIDYCLRENPASLVNRPFKMIDEKFSLFVFHPDDTVRFMDKYDAGTMAERVQYFQQLLDREKTLGQLLLSCGEKVRMDDDRLYSRTNARPFVTKCLTDGFMDVLVSRYPDDD